MFTQISKFTKQYLQISGLGAGQQVLDRRHVFIILIVVHPGMFSVLDNILFLMIEKLFYHIHVMANTDLYRQTITMCQSGVLKSALV